MSPSEFLAAMFGPSTGAPVCLCALTNMVSGGPVERCVVTRDLYAIEKFITTWDKPSRGLYFCPATLRRDATNRQGAAKPDDVDLYNRLAGNLRRHLETLGLKRVPREVGPPSLAQISARLKEARHEFPR